MQDHPSIPYPSRRDFLKYVSLGAGAAALHGHPLLADNLPSATLGKDMPTIPYGAVYFRKTNPPPEEWERDYKQAAADGMNCFRHWFMWSAIEVAPGKYDWSDYDAQMDLAAKYGIRTIIGIFLDLAPQWAFKDYPHARIHVVRGSKVQTRLDIPVGTPAHSHYTGASAVGGWPGLNFDNEEVKELGHRFLKALVNRYKDHPGLGGYNVWNELNHYGDFGACHSPASTEKFRIWLKEKYGDVETLGKAWYRYSFRDWNDVEIPKTIDPYPDNMDWILFRRDNAMRLFKERLDVIKELDSKALITLHAIPLGTLQNLGPETYPIFEAGRLVDIHGFSGGSNHEENSRLRWMHWAKMELTRSAAEGKPVWGTESPSGNSWGMKGMEIDRGRIASSSDIKLFNLTHFAGGIRGVFSPRWRPLQDGKHVGNFAFYAMDGSPTDRSEAASEIATWANDSRNADLWKADSVRGDLGIVVVPESQIHDYVKYRSSRNYYRSITGAYQAFLFNSIQADFVSYDRINDDYDVLYLPHPVMLPEAVAQDLKDWVARGGTLISEGCPAYFGDGGKAGLSQPHYGLDELFGVEQAYVQFTPDLLDDLTVKMDNGARFQGGVYLQTYAPNTGKAVGHFEDGRVAVVDNEFGKGRTRLIGTFPGYGYLQSYDQDTRRFFANLIPWAGKQQHVATGDERAIARIQTNADQSLRFVWVINSSREDVPVQLVVSEAFGPVKASKSFWGNNASLTRNGTLQATVPARDALALQLL